MPYTPATRFLIASDSFKGTLSSSQVAEIVREEIEHAMPHTQVQSFVLGDGGEGTLEAFASTDGATRKNCRVTGPLGNVVEAEYLLMEREGASTAAFIEAAAANGLHLVSQEKRNPLNTTSYGLGELIHAALDAGASEIGVGLGGSATNDGGMGCLRALGARFADADGAELSGYGCELSRLAKIDISGLDARLHTAQIRAMCDVANPLLGPQGATLVFGAQKGASVAQLHELEEGMQNYAKLAASVLGRDFSTTAGAGAAGGLGFALHAFLGAELASGIDVVLDLINFDVALEQADICITGEGFFDAQTAGGKLVSGVAQRCERAGVPCLCICGAADRSAAEVALPGLSRVIPTVSSEFFEHHELTSECAQQNLRSCVRRVFGELASGKDLCRVC